LLGVRDSRTAGDNRLVRDTSRSAAASVSGMAVTNTAGTMESRAALKVVARRW
jgi:hypothetical protein